MNEQNINEQNIRNYYLEVLLTEVKQNKIGFFTGKIDVNDIKNIFTVNAATYKLSNIKSQQDSEVDSDDLPIDGGLYIDKLKKESKDGYQRFEEPDRIKEIADYIKQANENIFHLIPNSIIFSLQVEECTEDKELLELSKTNPRGIALMDKDLEGYPFKALLIPKDILTEEENYKPLLVIDGHHRLQGAKRFLENSATDSYEVSATFIFNQISKAEAELFKTINYKAVKVNASYVYQIMGSFLIADSNHEIYLHEVARLFNETATSPLYSRFKMLGKADKGSPLKQTISQAFFIEHVYDWLFSDRTIKQIQDLDKVKKIPVLLPFYRAEQKYSTRVLIKYFMALQKSYNAKYPNEPWNHEENYFVKTIPLGALVAVFPIVFFLTFTQTTYSLEKFYSELDTTNLFDNIVDKIFINTDIKTEYIQTYSGSSGQGTVNKIANELFLPLLLKDEIVNDLIPKINDYITKHINRVNTLF